MNFRSSIIELALKVVIKASLEHRLHALEVGTMFKDDEGLSTFIIAKNTKQFEGEKVFVSIDNDQKHINSSIQMLQRLDSSLLTEIRFCCNYSLEILPEILQDLKFIDFVLLDGGAHPEVCLREFEIVLDHLHEKGIILIDDLQELSPSDAYPLQRPFGKGTLILPWLTIANYLKGQNISDDKLKSRSISKLHALIPNKEIINVLGKVDYVVISKGGHKMMAIGNQLVINDFSKMLSNLNDEQIHFSILDEHRKPFLIDATQKLVNHINSDSNRYSTLLKSDENKQNEIDKKCIIEELERVYFTDDCHEKEVIDNLKILDSVQVFVDVGASLGQYSYYVNKKIRNGQIYAIEADPLRVEQLEINCKNGRN